MRDLNSYITKGNHFPEGDLERDYFVLKDLVKCEKAIQ